MEISRWKQRSIKEYTEFWNGIKNKIGIINGGRTSVFGIDFMKIKFDLDDDLPMNKQLKFPRMTIVVRCVFKDKGKFYPQIYLEECLREL